MGSNDTWKIAPLTSCILEVLEKRGGVILENDLDNPLREIYGDFSITEINRALMSLENQGLVHVSWVSKTRRRIQKMTQDMVIMGVEED